MYVALSQEARRSAVVGMVRWWVVVLSLRPHGGRSCEAGDESEQGFHRSSAVAVGGRGSGVLRPSEGAGLGTDQVKWVSSKKKASKPYGLVYMQGTQLWWLFLVVVVCEAVVVMCEVGVVVVVVGDYVGVGVSG